MEQDGKKAQSIPRDLSKLVLSFDDPVGLIVKAGPSNPLCVSYSLEADGPMNSEIHFRWISPIALFFDELVVSSAI